jgi:glycerophosphoryl diester phosphodiesterase
MAFIIAHRAGNDLEQLREAEGLGVNFVEADLRLWRDRVEVRHLKTIGPIPIFWDRWRLANPFSRQLRMEELLEAVAPGTELLLDLKGRDPRLAQLVLTQLPSDRPITVCARNWRLLEPFRGRPNIRVVYSVGTNRQLRRLLRRFDGRNIDGVSIHERLLNVHTVAELRRRASVIMTWPINTPHRAHELMAMGVHGLISDDLALHGALPMSSARA